jgi:hypothetical protein
MVIAIAAMRDLSLCSFALHAAGIIWTVSVPGVPLRFTPGYQHVAPTELKQPYLVVVCVIAYFNLVL